MKIIVNDVAGATKSEISAIKSEINKVLKLEKVNKIKSRKIEVFINLIKDSLMKQLNTKYRKKDKTTDFNFVSVSNATQTAPVTTTTVTNE